MTAPYDIRIESINSLQCLESLWTDLQARAPCSYFRSWGWIGTWLASLPAHVSPTLVQILEADRVVGLAVVCQNSVRYPLFNTRGLFIHETGSLDHDRLTIEYNGLLLERQEDSGLLKHIFSELQRRLNWDEIRIGGLEASLAPVYSAAAAAIDLIPVSRDEKPCFGVDLSAVRNAGGDYLSGLSRNTRYQIRRAIREYEKRGPLQLTVARDLPTTQDLLARLQERHQQYWTQKGQPGAFSTRWVKDFHDRLVSTRFSNGEIQLIEVRCGEDTIAYLYNFVWQNKVYCYQSGLLFEENSHLKPGLVAHTLAIEHNLAAGNDYYDFLMGRERYKKNLGNTNTDMIWISLRKNLLRYRLHDTLASVKSRILARIKTNQPARSAS